MALPSVISLKHKIEDLLNSSDISSPEIIEFAYKQVESLEEIAKRISWSSMSWLLIEIADAVQKLEDAIESYVSKEIVSQSESRRDVIQFSIDNAHDLEKEIHSFTERVKQMTEEYADELYNSLPEEEEDDDDNDGGGGGGGGGGGQKSKMVGFSKQFNEVKRKLITEGTSFEVFSLVGMPGIGKTTLAKEVFKDPDIVEHFESRVWVRVGRKHQLKEIPRRILAQLNPGDQMLGTGDEDIAQYLKECLKGKRYLIVLDDVWDKYMACHLQPSYQNGRNESKNPFPNEENGSRVLLTTRLQQVDEDGNQLSRDDSTLQQLNEEESWDLLRDKVFAEKSCPSQLEAAGKKIAENCDGLPLMIVTVADLLSKAEKTPQYWSGVAAQKNHQLFMAAYEKISKVLLPSYQYLPRLLQTCFLYMGVFPKDDEIPRSKLINMWNADGFLQQKRNLNSFSYPDAMECLEELGYNSLVMLYQSTIETSLAVGQKQIKTCGLHSSLWHLSNREAEKIKFSYVLSSYNDCLGEGIKGQRRLCFHNNILLSIKGLYKLVEDNCASTTRSLLCYGPYHQYQLTICFSLKMLRELDALSIRFYEFPMEVLQLVQLRYLALTMNGEIPASIAGLSELQFLIVDRHSSIRSLQDHASYLPVEIWDMKNLQHIQVKGSDLPDPRGTSLESLSTLSNVSVHSCTEGVLTAIPNLKKLGIRIDLGPDDVGTPLNCFDHISHFIFLNSLKCVIVNPEVVPPVAPFSILPQYITKLSLSGLGYPWKEMSKIALLTHLNVLKLRNYAFRGPEWDVEEKGFPSLRSLVIEDADLVEWKIGHESFQCLDSLYIKHCYKLVRIHGDFHISLEKIEFVDCDPLSVERMKKAIRTQKEVGVHSSWNDGKVKKRLATQLVRKINYLEGEWTLG